MSKRRIEEMSQGELYALVKRLGNEMKHLPFGDELDKRSREQMVAVQTLAKAKKI